MRLTFLQYGGDYREAWTRFDRGGKATYQAQRYSVNFVGSLAQQHDQVAVVCGVTEAAYDTLLPNGVRSIGAGLEPGFDESKMLPLIERTEPDRLVLVTPSIAALSWARSRGVKTLATLADSFDGKLTVRGWLRRRKLASLLNHPTVDWVGNHGLAACRSLERLGVRPDKIVPWDWPASHRPTDYPARERGSGPFRVAYVGSVTEAKGVGDLLRAVRSLIVEGFPVSAVVVGKDEGGWAEQLAKQLQLGEHVEFAGVVANEEIPTLMRSVDAVIVPSHHEYPEGLPLTIYEALATRTPIIASDHPMFATALADGFSALTFPAKDDEALANAIRRLAGDASLYSLLSANSADAWQAIQLPTVWGELISNWLDGSNPSRTWIQERSIASGRYDEQLKQAR